MKKLTKKALKQPDQFVGFWHIAGERVGRFVAANRRVLVIGISALVTVVVGIIATSLLQEQRAGKATVALERAQKIAGAELTPPVAPRNEAKDDSIPSSRPRKSGLEGALKELDGPVRVGARAPLGGGGGSGSRQPAAGASTAPTRPRRCTRSSWVSKSQRLGFGSWRARGSATPTRGRASWRRRRRRSRSWARMPPALGDFYKDKGPLP